eukprot:CAMPEP_0171480358 /NCGR_PEP_ID=MMETSP0946-20130122/6016_1 /TAXON_ID=109269 /ORGANISM="Vaucheria litorea, Strain CCMP2940" /LENGTH=198 /DNA_ID=CAMNT_0012011551 /DNA_START=108 /DNA_END=701 /DNA_ORIENTATION=+
MPHQQPPPQQSVQRPYIARQSVQRAQLQTTVQLPAGSNLVQHGTKSDPGVSSGPPRTYGKKSMELIEQLKNEVDGMANEIVTLRMEKEEYEQKFRQNMMELESIQQTIGSLREAYAQMKSSYEEELSLYREKKGTNAPNSGNTQPRSTVPSPLHISTSPGNINAMNTKQNNNRSNTSSMLPRGNSMIMDMKNGNERIW